MGVDATAFRCIECVENYLINDGVSTEGGFRHRVASKMSKNLIFTKYQSAPLLLIKFLSQPWTNFILLQ